MYINCILFFPLKNDQSFLKFVKQTYDDLLKNKIRLVKIMKYYSMYITLKSQLCNRNVM